MSALRALLFCSVVVAGGSIVFTPACKSRCRSIFDCGDQSYCDFDFHCTTDCFEDNDCRQSGKGFRCVQAQGRCAGPPGGGFDEGSPPIGPIDDTWDGYDAPPNTGKTFIISALGISTESANALNIDGDCDTSGRCGDNALGAAAGYANPLLENGVEFGESLIIIEIAGIDEIANDYDRVTIKIYGAVDAENPPRYNNNFKNPPGENTCCAFLLDSQSISGGQATARIRSRIDNGQILPVELNDATFTLALGRAPHPQIHLKSSAVKGRINRDGIFGAVLGGAVPMSDLANSAADPFCLPNEPNCSTTTIADRTVLDLISALIAQPDIDIDGDGLECTYRTSGNPEVDGCCDGAGVARCLKSDGSCMGAVIAPLDPNRNASCAERSEIRDAYSVAFSFDAVPATVVGVR